MKTILFYLVFLTSLISCSNEVVKEDSFKAEPFSENATQKWKLVKMTNSWTNSTTTGKDMAWQEYIIFNSDGSFVKYRTRDGVNTEASGTFRKETGKDANETVFISLTYSSQSELIASCTSQDLSEVLILNSDKTLCGTWNQCDGPGLIYELSK